MMVREMDEEWRALPALAIPLQLALEAVETDLDILTSDGVSLDLGGGLVAQGGPGGGGREHEGTPGEQGDWGCAVQGTDQGGSY